MRILKINVEKGKIHKFGSNTITNSQDITDTINNEDFAQKVKKDIETITKANPLFSGESEESKKHLANFENQFGYQFNFDNLLAREIVKSAKKSKAMVIAETKAEAQICIDCGVSYIYYQVEAVKEEKAKK